MTALEREIISLLERGGVSFVELSEIDGFKGDQEIGLTERNIVYWRGVSLEAANILMRLQDDGVFHFAPTELFVYIIDGCTLRLPLVKSATKYKTPHWCPVALNKGPVKQSSKSTKAPRVSA
jgi:hypothetical protein